MLSRFPYYTIDQLNQPIAPTMNKSTRRATRLCLLAIALATIGRANAIPIVGSTQFSGTATGMQSGGISTLTLDNPMTFTFGTVDYSGIASGTPAVFAPISWTGSGFAAMLTSSNNPEWTIVAGGTTYQFSLLSLSSATMTSTGFSLVGGGISTITGGINRDPTFTEFTLQGTGSGFNYTIGVVPEPEAIVFLALGAAVLLLFAKRRQRI